MGGAHRPNPCIHERGQCVIVCRARHAGGQCLVRGQPKRLAATTPVRDVVCYATMAPIRLAHGRAIKEEAAAIGFKGCDRIGRACLKRHGHQARGPIKGGWEFVQGQGARCRLNVAALRLLEKLLDEFKRRFREGIRQAADTRNDVCDKKFFQGAGVEWPNRQIVDDRADFS